MADLNAMKQDVWGTPASSPIEAMKQDLWGGTPAAPESPTPAGTPGVQPGRWQITIKSPGGQTGTVEVPGSWDDATGTIAAMRQQFHPDTQFGIAPVPTAEVPYQGPPSDPSLATRNPPAEDLPLQESLNPVELAILGQGVSIGAGLGALRGPVSRVVGAGLGGLIANRANRGIGYTPGGAFGPVDPGDIVTTALPMAAEGIPLAWQVSRNASQGRTPLPEDRALIDLAQEHNINQGLTYGDVLGPARNPAVARSQVNLERTPQGIATRQAGQAETKAAAEGFTEHYGGQVAGDYADMPAVEAAANAGNREAAYTRDLVQRTPDTDPGAVVQASAKVKLVNQKLQADALYADRDKLAAQLGNRIDTPNTLTAGYQALDQIQSGVLNLDPSGTTRKQVEAILTRFEPTRTPHPQFPGVLPDTEAPAMVRYGDLTRLKHELNLAINKTSATPFEQDLLGTIKDGVEADMKSAALASGKPELIAAQQKADAFYPQVVKQRDFVQSIEDKPPDQVVPALIKRGQEDRAEAAFKALDPKGQAAVRADILNRAMYEGNAPAVQPGTGHFSPARFAKNMEDLRAATGVFFPTTGEQKWQLDGFTNLMRHLERNGYFTENPPTGQRLFDVLDTGTMGQAAAGAVTGYYTGGVKAAAGGAMLPVANAARKAVTSWALMTPRGRDLLLAASDLPAGSRAMQDVLVSAAKDTPGLQALVGRGLGLTPEEEEPR